MKRLSVSMDDALAAAIETAAQRNNRSVAQEISSRLTTTLGADVVLGWIKLDRWGELDDRDCPQCNQTIKMAYVAILSNGSVYGPVCDLCATSQ